MNYSAPAADGATTSSKEEADDPFATAGRNDPCPCGSGRKFKQCHGRPGA
ncbi:MAG: SEC-C metal-binding domain-containing protein [Propionibacteriaceae bacterium]